MKTEDEITTAMGVIESVYEDNKETKDDERQLALSSLAGMTSALLWVVDSDPTALDELLKRAGVAIGSIQSKYIKLDVVKQRFKRAMRVSGAGPTGKEDFRQRVRLFVAGWMEHSVETGAKLPEPTSTMEIFDINWWPDATWKWW